MPPLFPVVCAHGCTHAMEFAFEAQNLARHEPECLRGCAAYSFDLGKYCAGKNILSPRDFSIAGAIAYVV